MRPIRHNPAARRGQRPNDPVQILVELIPAALEQPAADLGELVEELFPLAIARVGEALAAQNWEEWWGRLHGAGVAAQPPAGARATYAVRHWQVFADSLSDAERGKLRASLLRALQVQRTPGPNGVPVDEAIPPRTEAVRADDESWRGNGSAGQAANERAVVLRRVDAAAGLVNNPHHDRQTGVQDP
ncbi:MAG: hypothetical protein U0836_15655 [Pirellulales bacterium]